MDRFYVKLKELFDIDETAGLKFCREHFSVVAEDLKRNDDGTVNVSLLLNLVVSRYNSLEFNTNPVFKDPDRRRRYYKRAANGNHYRKGAYIWHAYEVIASYKDHFNLTEAASRLKMAAETIGHIVSAEECKRKILAVLENERGFGFIEFKEIAPEEFDFKIIL